MADVLEFILLMKNVQKFVGDAEKASGAVKGVGTATEKTGKQATAGWKGMLKYAAGTAAIYGGARFLKSAVDQTNQLAKATRAVTIQTGLDTQTSSEWVALTKERGIQTGTFQRGLVTLAKSMDTARLGTSKSNTVIAGLRSQIDAVAQAGGKDAPKQLAKLSAGIVTAQKSSEKARQVFERLGIPLDQLQKGTTGQTLMRIADSFKAMKDPVERARLAQQLFGKAGIQLLPVLSRGSAGVRELLDEQKKAGNYLDSKGLKQQMENIKQQRALEAAFAGLKVQMTLALMPAILAVGKLFVGLMQILRPVTAHAKVMRWVILGLAAAFIAWKFAMLAQKALIVATIGVTKEYTAAQWLLNVAMDANVIMLVVIALAALVVGFLYAYKHVKVFREAVDWTWKVLLAGAKLVWGWIKTYWPYLLGILAGPFGLAAVVIYKHFGAIKDFVTGVVSDIKKTFENLVKYVENLPHRLSKSLSKLPGYHQASGALGAIGSAGSFVGKHLADGGVVSRAGAFMVGERGRELVALPAGAAVSPLAAGDGLFGGRGGGGQPIEVHVPVYLDGKPIARSVAKVTADRLARR